LPWRFWWIPQ